MASVSRTRDRAAITHPVYNSHMAGISMDSTSNLTVI